MNKKHYIIIAILFLLYAFQLWIKYFTTYTGFIRNYLADIIALPLILIASLTIIRKVKKLPFMYLSKGMILFSFIYISFIFEYVLPKYYTKFTPDFFDVLSYLLGAILFYFVQEKLKKDEYYKTT